MLIRSPCVDHKGAVARKSASNTNRLARIRPQVLRLVWHFYIRSCIVVQFLLAIAHIKYAQGVPKYGLCLVNIQVIKFVFVFLEILRIKLPNLVECRCTWRNDKKEEK
jgi:uncharacterized membrane protein